MKKSEEQNNPEKAIVTISSKEAATLIGCTPQQIYNQIKTGRLRVHCHSSGYLRFWFNVDKNGKFHEILKSKCWKWGKTTHNGGYGKFILGGVEIRAHRYSWEIHFGKIPEGLQVLHRCDNPECTNPKHLFIGTHQDNMKDRDQKGRQYRPIGYLNVMRRRPELRHFGDRNGSRTCPDRRPFGDRNGSRKYPERLPRGDSHYSVTHPEKTCKGENHGISKLTDREVRLIRKLHLKGKVTQGKLAVQFNISQSQISCIVCGKAWSHVK